ncbi:hypothetical protein OC835_002545 [Tilletia horrida]|nr:hypothetical protein OC835_002545 [Tilletia horrida]
MKKTTAFVWLAVSILLSIIHTGLATWLAIWSFGPPSRSNGNGNSYNNTNWTYRMIFGSINVVFALYELAWVALYIPPAALPALAAARRRHDDYHDIRGNNSGRPQPMMDKTAARLRRFDSQYGPAIWFVGVFLSAARIISGAGSVSRPPGFSAQKRIAYGIGFGASILIQFLCVQRNAWWHRIHQALVNYASDKEREVALDVEHEAEAAHQARLDTLRQAKAAGNGLAQSPA